MIFDILDYREKLDYNNAIEANKTARQIAKNKKENIEDSLFSNLFKGDEFLDDGIIRVLSFSEIWGMERLFKLVFIDDSIKLTRWNIAAIAKHCSDRLSTSWDIVLKWITKMQPLEIKDSIPPSTFINTASSIENMGYIIPRYFYKASKLSKDKLIKTIKVDSVQCLYDNSELIAMFPCKAYDHYGWIDARTEIKYALETILRKVPASDRLFKGDIFLERILERSISNEACILTPIGKSSMLDIINQLSEEYYNIKLKKYKQDFNKWLDKYTFVFYDLVISDRINEYVSNDWEREILSKCRPVSDACISKAFQIINSEDLVDKVKCEFNLSSYSFRVFESLISAMNLKAIDMLYNYLVIKGVTPNQNIAASFIYGISAVYFKKKDYTYQHTKMCESMGHKWELMCRIISKYLYGDKTIVHTRLRNGNIPDIAVHDELYSTEKYPLIIECKRGYSIRDIEACILKYLSYCDKLEFWILKSKIDKEEGVPLYLIDPLRDSYLNYMNAYAKTRIMFFEDVLDQIRENTFLVNEVNRLWTENQEITYTYVIKKQIEQKCKDEGLKDRLITLFDTLVPCLNWNGFEGIEDEK